MVAHTYTKPNVQHIVTLATFVFIYQQNDIFGTLQTSRNNKIIFLLKFI